MCADQGIGARREQIRALNDALRKSMAGGHWMVSDGIIARGSLFTDAAIDAVVKFGGFNYDNDPHNEHDFGVVEIEGIKVFFKIDYYDLDLRFGSPDPSNPGITKRVLTVMLAEEY